MLTRGAVNSLHLPYVHIYDLHIIIALYGLWALDWVINLLLDSLTVKARPQHGGRVARFGKSGVPFWSADENISLKVEILLATIRR